MHSYRLEFSVDTCALGFVEVIPLKGECTQGGQQFLT